MRARQSGAGSASWGASPTQPTSPVPGVGQHVPEPGVGAGAEPAVARQLDQLDAGGQAGPDGRQRVGSRAVVDDDDPHAAATSWSRNRAHGRHAPVGAVPVEDDDGEHPAIMAGDRTRGRAVGRLGGWDDGARADARFIDDRLRPFHACHDGGGPARRRRVRRGRGDGGLARRSPEAATCAGAAAWWPGRRARATPPTSRVPGRRRPHRQPQPAGQAAPRHRAAPATGSSRWRSTAARC